MMRQINSKVRRKAEAMGFEIGFVNEEDEALMDSIEAADAQGDGWVAVDLDKVEGATDAAAEPEPVEPEPAAPEAPAEPLSIAADVDAGA